MRRTPRRYETTSKTEVLPEECATAEQHKEQHKTRPAAAEVPRPYLVLPREAHWQAILFSDNRALGKLVSPTVYNHPAGPAPDGQEPEAEVQQEQPPAVRQLSLHFTHLVPAGIAGSSGSEAQPLCLPVDECFPKHAYRVQVIGSQHGASFAVPHSFQADGRELTAALNVQQQWQEFQRRHQAARTSAGQPTSPANFAHSSTLTVQNGDGLDRFQAIFDVATRPAWLKGIVCRFLVAEPAQPTSGEAVNGSSSSKAPKEQGGAAATAAAVASATAVTSAEMAAPEAARRRAEQEPSSRVAPKLQEKQQQPPPPSAAAQVPKQMQATPAAAPGSQGPAGTSGVQANAAKHQKKKAQAHQQHDADQAAATAGSGSSPSAEPVAPAAAVALPQGAAKGSRPAVAASEPVVRPASRVSEPVAAAADRSASRSSSKSARSSRGSRASSSTPAPDSSPASSDLTTQPNSSRAGAAAAARSVQQQQSPADDAVAAAAAAAAAGRGLTGGRRHRSRSRQRAGQEVSIVRRLPMLFPCPADQKPQPAAAAAAAAGADNDSFVSGPNRRVPPNSPAAEPASSGSTAGSSSRASSSMSQHSTPGDPPARSSSSSNRAEQQPGGAAGSMLPGGTQAPGCQTAAPAAARTPGMPAAAVATRSQPLASQPPQPKPADVLARAAPVACSADGGKPDPAPPAVAVDPECIKQAPFAEDSALAAAAAAAWQCELEKSSALAAAAAEAAAATMTAAAAACTPPIPPPPPLRPTSSCGLGSSNASASVRPASPRSGGSGESVCSDGSGQSHQSESCWSAPGNPSEFGLPYNFGRNPLVFQWQEPHQGRPMPGQRQGHAAPHQRPSAEQYRPMRGGGNAFGSSRSMPPPMPSSSSGGSSGYGAPGCGMPLPAQQMNFHRRSGSSSSSSHSGGSSGGANGGGNAAAFAAYQAGMAAQWQGNGGCCSDGYVGSQAPQSPFMSRSHSTGMPQWAGRQPSHGGEPYAAAAALHRQPQQRSTSWLPDSMHLEAGGSAPYYPTSQPSQPPMVRASTGSDHSRGGRPSAGFAGGCSYGYHSPASAPGTRMSSPDVKMGRQLAPPATAPPPPPLPLTVLDLQVPESVDDSPDLERFIQAATPQVVLPAGGAQDLTLADVWRWYEEPSTIGCEVTTVGGPRGPSTSYFLPYLSAVQLLVPAASSDLAAAAAAAAGGSAEPPPLLLSYPNGLDSWPERMRPLVQWGETANMRDRLPLHSRLQDVCGRTGEQHPLMATRLADLHPFSWFAVAWYPLYCVPEAPLTARFLTFHTLASLWESASEAADRHPQQQSQQQQPDGQQHGLGAAAAAAAVQAEAAPETPLVTAAPPRSQAPQGLADRAAVPGLPASAAALPYRPSYKSMLAAGLQQQPTQHSADTAPTPTAIASFPSSPTGSDAGTRTTSVDGGAGSVGGGIGRSRLGGGSASSSAQCLSSGCGCGSLHEPCGTPCASPSLAGSSMPASLAASDAGDGMEQQQAGAAPEPALPVPVAGLAWYATGREENWTDTLVAAPLPPDMYPSPAAGTPLADGACVVGSWRGVAVLSRTYPVAKGGPLGWEIQQEEMAQCAERLANGTGLVALRPRRYGGGNGYGRAPAAAAAGWEPVAGLPPGALGVSCPDYEFFLSRMQRYG